MSTKNFGNITLNENGTANALDVQIGASAYNTGHLTLGTYHFWVDSGGKLRVKSGVPNSDIDGSLVGTITPTSSTTTVNEIAIYSSTSGSALLGSGISVATGGALQTIGVGNGTILPNARGTGAIDLQTFRTGTASVASGLYSTISGGYNNRASGNYASVLGGLSCQATGDYAIAGGQSSIASSNCSVALGISCQATNTNSVALGNTAIASGISSVGIGTFMTASGIASAAIGGNTNTASGNYAATIGGLGCIANANYSATIAGSYGKTNNVGEVVFSNGRFAVTGDAQASIVVGRATTTNTATPTEMYLDGISASINIPTDSTQSYYIQVIARGIAGTNDNKAAFFEAKGCISNNAGTLTLHPGNSITTLNSDVAAWAITIGVSSTKLVISVKGDATSTVQWVANIQSVLNIG